MDAGLFGQWLKDNICLPTGMTHIVNTVERVVQREDASVEKIITKEGNHIHADLFIDCSGFRSILLDQTLNEPFTSFHDTLLNDRAVATVIPYIDKEIEKVSSEKLSPNELDEWIEENFRDSFN